MSERRAFLDRIRSRQGPPPATGPHPPPAPPETVPVMRYRNLDESGEDLLAVFVATARAADATVDVCPPSDVDGAVARMLDVVAVASPRATAVVSSEPEVREFADALVRAGVFVTDYSPKTAATADIALTSATHGIAATGSVVVDSHTAGSRAVSLLPQVHVCVLPVERIVADPSQVLRRMDPDDMPSCRVLITGPSRTGDIEQRLTLGAHGPVALHLIVTTD